MCISGRPSFLSLPNKREILNSQNDFPPKKGWLISSGELFRHEWLEKTGIKPNERSA